MPESVLDPAAAPAAPATDTTAPANTGASSSPAVAAPTGGVTAPAGQPAAAPLEYKLTLPESAAFAPDAIERAVALSRELNIAPEAAQKVLSHFDSEAAARMTAQAQAVATEHAAQVAEWRKQTLANPALGKTPDERKAAIDRGIGVIAHYEKVDKEGAALLRQFLNETGYGNHPALVGFLAHLGKSMSEPQSVPKGAPAVDEKDWRKTWFPNTYKDDNAA